MFTANAKLRPPQTANDDKHKLISTTDKKYKLAL